MLKLMAALLVGGLLLASSGCCWPLHDGYHHGRGWGERGSYDHPGRSHGSRSRSYPSAPAPYHR